MAGRSPPLGCTRGWVTSHRFSLNVEEQSRFSADPCGLRPRVTSVELRPAERQYRRPARTPPRSRVFQCETVECPLLRLCRRGCLVIGRLKHLVRMSSSHTCCTSSWSSDRPLAQHLRFFSLHLHRALQDHQLGHIEAIPASVSAWRTVGRLWRAVHYRVAFMRMSSVPAARKKHFVCRGIRRDGEHSSLVEHPATEPLSPKFPRTC